MKTLKILFSLLILSMIIFSCTPQALDDDPNTLPDNIEATGGEDTSPDNGSKD